MGMEIEMVESIVVSNEYIVKTPGICGGRARIDGTRIGVEIIAGLYQSGATVEEIAAGYSDSDVTPAKVHAALAYYYDNQAEIDAVLDDIQQMANTEQEHNDRLRTDKGLPPAGAYITSREAAEILGIDHESRWVARLCRNGQLDCRKMGRDWLVSRESVEAYAQSNRKPGPKSAGG
jgi:excisionase family DNA binding protein